MTALLNVHDLRAYYGQVQALHGLSFSLNEGSLTTLLRANGAGKTTTLRAICNMVRSTGAIEFDGKPLNHRSTENIVRFGIAHVPQGRGTFTNMTVEENLQLGAITRKDNAGIVSDIERMYAYFPVLKQRHTQQAGTLSGGEQQMLAVARALMLRPRHPSGLRRWSCAISSGSSARSTARTRCRSWSSSRTPSSRSNSPTRPM